MKKSILIVGDSLGLPRENISYDKTWPYKLTSTLEEYHVICKLQRALTTIMINSGVYFDWLEFYTPSDVILQVGIVDCSPRYLKNGGFLMRLIGIAPTFIKSQVWKLIKRFRHRSSSNADVSIEDFEKNLLRYINRCEKINVERIFIVKIAKSGNAMIKQNPEVLKQIELYNKVIDELVAGKKKCIIIPELAAADDTYFLEDGYHLNEYGNEQLFKGIMKYYK
jgi:acyl-CoA thioesterase-1